MSSLSELGFRPELLPSDFDLYASLELGRVARVERGHAVVWGVSATHPLPLAGRIEATPVVGDWVQVEGGAKVVNILPRSRTLARRRVGGGEPQVLAAHLDTVFIVSAVGADLSPRRIERYLALVREGGAKPVVVLNKIDQGFDIQATLSTIEAAAPQVPLAMVSGKKGDLKELEPFLHPGATIAMVGSSGVGKSTLLNSLIGEAIQKTGAVREDDGKGRHTTTHRELFRLPCGALVIDTPGMREVGLIDLAEGLDATFADVSTIANRCRFPNCQHNSEPGCAVQEALEAGELSPDRWASHERLRKEADYEARRSDAREANNAKRRWKSIRKGLRERYKLDPKLRRD